MAALRVGLLATCDGNRDQSNTEQDRLGAQPDGTQPGRRSVQDVQGLGSSRDTDFRGCLHFSFTFPSLFHFSHIGSFEGLRFFR